MLALDNWKQVGEVLRSETEHDKGGITHLFIGVVKRPSRDLDVLFEC